MLNTGLRRTTEPGDARIHPSSTPSCLARRSAGSASSIR